ncbi:BaeS Signal transduction histidine kinase [Pyrenophora tritici-repentis]|uniref:Protein-serine/threonine kinase n=2 Tax=Pyrenophora tritici-repentis TaxID=45151 RepID=A0A2W1I2L4_9PLEO|nr:Kinase isozyme 4 mitochondrial [Pyrenophora tritici-repentis]KAF7569763.1 BaeS, Signal transduction histidine kinase [Pyrenophora tritici-repentis]KAI0581957.1 Kinase isozyme 4 mitochondrial [Pyrenophora tritici-repentis]KAI0589627.1 Kinase isozyme 4 mitochondrial [Pyrenophora tritici-repentis]KAI0612781.1 Kinase isozyme 4 mitochondrial [Pyrenophora tritici-repentis]
MMAQIQRPLMIQSQFIRLCCPRTARRTTKALFARGNFQRKLHTKTVTDNDISRLASLPLHPLTLADLVKHGRPPLTTQQLLTSANFTLSILPARLAHRIQSLRNLPFIVVSNPNVSKIHSNYMHSLSTLLPWAEQEIKTLEEEVRFTEVMADLVQTHANTISILARGFLEARKYISPKDVTRFLDEHLRARIGTRLIAEQHLSLHFSSQPHCEVMHDVEDNPGYIGVIDTRLKPARIVDHCANVVGEICELKYGVRPTVVINGEPDYEFAHVPVHLEYIITELLKNAFRATVESGMEREPIEVTIAPLPELLPEDTKSTESEDIRNEKVENDDQGNTDVASQRFTGNKSTTSPPTASNILPLKHSTPGVTIRIRDRGGGISPENMAHIWDYSFTTFNDSQASSTLSGGNHSGNGMDALGAFSGAGGDGAHSLAGLGYGLPLGRAYAEYFGGGIAVQSLWGWGADVYLSLRGVGRVENVEEAAESAKRKQR